MELYPIKIDVSIEQLFGKDYKNILYDYEIKIIQDAIEDGVIDSDDLSSKISSQVCNEYSGRNRRFLKSKDRFLFSCNDEIIRRLHFQLSRFAKSGSENLLIGIYEAQVFNVFIRNEMLGNKTGLEIIRGGSNNLMLGADLYCQQSDYKDGKRCETVIVDDSKLLLITHATSEYDNETAKAGIDKLTTEFQKKHFQFIYLVEGFRPFTGVYPANKNPSKYIHSLSGEHPIDFRGDTLVLAGGYFSRCYMYSLFEILHNRSVNTNLNIKIYSDAVFTAFGGHRKTFDDHHKTLKDCFNDIDTEKAVNYIKESMVYILEKFKRLYRNEGLYEKQNYMKYNINFVYAGKIYWINEPIEGLPTVNIEIIL